MKKSPRFRHKSAAAGCLLLAGLLSALPGAAQIPEYKIQSDKPHQDDQFGNAVAISGDYAIIGARRDDQAGKGAGAAYIFKREGSHWRLQAKLLARDAAAIDYFGAAVDLDGDFALVGAPLDDDGSEDAGAAYVFRREDENWLQQAKLTAGDPGRKDKFGAAVAIHSDYLIIGTPLDDNQAGGNAGAAYVFKREGELWNLQAKLIATGPDTKDDEFGISVDINAEYAVIGAYRDYLEGGGGNLANSGSAYIFKRRDTNWSQETKLLASDAPASHFGYSVCISSGFALIGAYGGDWGGSAYVFQRMDTIWTQQAKLKALDEAAGDNFGISVALNEDQALIGAHQDSDDGYFSGSAYLFKRTLTGWVQTAKLTASDAAAEDQFGLGVALAGDYALIGAPGDDDRGEASGSAYVYGPIGLGCAGFALPDTNAYGSLPGGDQAHVASVPYCFTGKPGDMLLTFQAYTLDDNEEVDILLNGSKLWDAPANAGNAWSRDLRVILPDSLVNDNAANELEFNNTKNPPQASPWGVRQVKVEPCFTLPAVQEYGYIENGDQSHLDRISYCFPPQNGTATIAFEAYDIDREGEVELWLNGAKALTLPVTGNNQWGGQVQVTLPDGLVDEASANLLVFDNVDNPPRTFQWGIRNVALVTTTLAVETPTPTLPLSLHLSQNFPNPFNPITTIRFELPVSGRVRLVVYDVTGQLVQTLVEGMMPAGAHRRAFDAGRLASGIYFYRLEAEGIAVTRKMAVAK